MCPMPPGATPMVIPSTRAMDLLHFDENSQNSYIPLFPNFARPFSHPAPGDMETIDTEPVDTRLF